VVDVLAAAVAANVGNAAFVVVAGGDTGVAMGAGVGLASTHQRGESVVGTLWGRGHAVEGIGFIGLVGLVGLAGLIGVIGGIRRWVVLLLLKVIHLRWPKPPRTEGGPQREVEVTRES